MSKRGDLTLLHSPKELARRAHKGRGRGLSQSVPRLRTLRWLDSTSVEQLLKGAGQETLGCVSRVLSIKPRPQESLQVADHLRRCREPKLFGLEIVRFTGHKKDIVKT